MATEVGNTVMVHLKTQDLELQRHVKSPFPHPSYPFIPRGGMGHFINQNTSPHPGRSIDRCIISYIMSASYNIIIMYHDYLDLQTTDGWSALMWSSQNGHVDVAQLLLEKGAKVDVQGKDGWLSLMAARQKGPC